MNPEMKTIIKRLAREQLILDLASVQHRPDIQDKLRTAKRDLGRHTAIPGEGSPRRERRHIERRLTKLARKAGLS